MRIASDNYNTLGRLGPHYERPEFRPPDANNGEQKSTPQNTVRGDRSTLSTKNAALRKSTPREAGNINLKTNLEQAFILIEATSAMISRLDPLSTSRGPHINLPSGLLAPRYV